MKTRTALSTRSTARTLADGTWWLTKRVLKPSAAEVAAAGAEDTEVVVAAAEVVVAVEEEVVVVEEVGAVTGVIAAIAGNRGFDFPYRASRSSLTPRCFLTKFLCSRSSSMSFAACVTSNDRFF